MKELIEALDNQLKSLKENNKQLGGLALYQELEAEIKYIGWETIEKRYIDRELNDLDKAMYEFYKFVYNNIKKGENK